MKPVSKRCAVFGTGYSTGTVFKSLQYSESFQDSTTIAFQAAFRNLYDMYGFLPDIWMWSDPHSSLEGLDLILSNKEMFKEKPLQIILPKYSDTSCRHSHRLYAGTSPVWRNVYMEEEYYSKLEEIKNVPGVIVTVQRVYTTKYMAMAPHKTKDCDNIFRNPVERFVLDRPIIGSFRYKTDNSHQDVWGRENKLSFFVFPMMVHLGCRDLEVAGFDFGGSRFFNENTQHAFSINQENLTDPVYKIVNIWTKEWYNYHGMKVNSLVGPGESGLVDILQA